MSSRWLELMPVYCFCCILFKVFWFFDIFIIIIKGRDDGASASNRVIDGGCHTLWMLIRYLNKLDEDRPCK